MMMNLKKKTVMMMDLKKKMVMMMGKMINEAEAVASMMTAFMVRTTCSCRGIRIPYANKIPGRSSCARNDFWLWVHELGSRRSGPGARCLVGGIAIVIVIVRKMAAMVTRMAIVMRNSSVVLLLCRRAACPGVKAWLGHRASPSDLKVDRTHPNKSKSALKHLFARSG